VLPSLCTAQIPASALAKEPKWFCPRCVTAPDAPPEAALQDPPPERRWPADGGADLVRLDELLRAPPPICLHG